MATATLLTASRSEQVAALARIKTDTEALVKAMSCAQNLLPEGFGRGMVAVAENLAVAARKKIEAALNERKEG